MEPHHVVEAVGIVVLGLVFYSYARRWFESTERAPRPARALLRILVNGLAFGLLTVALMIARIDVGQGVFVDARAVPIALITPVEGGWAGPSPRWWRASTAWRGSAAPARRRACSGLLATAGASGPGAGVGAARRGCARAPRVRPGRRRVHHHVRLVLARGRARIAIFTA